MKISKIENCWKCFHQDHLKGTIFIKKWGKGEDSEKIENLPKFKKMDIWLFLTEKIIH